MKIVTKNKLRIHGNEKGIATIVVIGAVLLVILAATLILALGGFKSTSNLPSFSSGDNTAKTEKAQNCQSSDYGGCDSEKNFYQWKDDGLRK